MGSADDFARLQLELNPHGTAFTERLTAATQQYNALKAIDRGLKADEMKFQSELQGLRDSLETTTRALTQTHAKRARLVRELAACDEDLVRLEASKQSTSERILQVTSNAANAREQKLRELETRHGVVSAVGAVTSSAPASPAIAAAGRSNGPIDLLGDEAAACSSSTVGGATGDLLDMHAGSAPAQPTQQVPLELLMGASAVSSTPTVVPGCGGLRGTTGSSPSSGFEGFNCSVERSSSGCGTSAGSQLPPGRSGSSRSSNPLDMKPPVVGARTSSTGSMAGAPMAMNGRPLSQSSFGGGGGGAAGSRLSGQAGAGGAREQDPFAGLTGIGK